MFYLYELRESDSNDCTVYDCIIEAEDREAADKAIGEHFDAIAKEKGWESDGGWGYYFPCDCENPEPEEPEIPCSQCEMIAVNGVPVHEEGCPEWRKYTRAKRAYEHFECEGHGGLTISEEPEEYETEEEAENACQRFHSRYTV